MNKIEFIDMLRRHISEVGDPAFVNDTIDYYQDYIDTAIRKGSSEEEVLAGLGDPRLIAKSIVASKDDSSGGHTDNIYGRNDDHDESAYGYNDRGSEGYDGPRGTGIYDGRFHVITRKGRDISLPVGIVRFAGVLAGIFALVVVGKIAFFLSPVIVVAILAILLYRFFRDNF